MPLRSATTSRPSSSAQLVLTLSLRSHCASASGCSCCAKKANRRHVVVIALAWTVYEGDGAPLSEHDEVRATHDGAQPCDAALRGEFFHGHVASHSYEAQDMKPCEELISYGWGYWTGWVAMAGATAHDAPVADTSFGGSREFAPPVPSERRCLGKGDSRRASA